jgi:hypothetical protein
MGKKKLLTSSLSLEEHNFGRAPNMAPRRIGRVNVRCVYASDVSNARQKFMCSNVGSQTH